MGGSKFQTVVSTPVGERVFMRCVHYPCEVLGIVTGGLFRALAWATQEEIPNAVEYIYPPPAYDKASA